MFRVEIEPHLFERLGRFSFKDKRKIVKQVIHEVRNSRLITFQKDGRERRLFGPRVYVTRYDPNTDTQHVITVLYAKSAFRNATPREREVWLSGSVG